MLDPQQLEVHKKNFAKITRAQFQNLYKVVKQLGKGSYGSVYKVISTQGQQLAIKQFYSSALRNFRQIIREVDNLKKLEHINIVRFYDCYIVDDTNYKIVIEYCQGGNLGQYIKTQYLSDLDRLMIVLQIAEGLSYAHQKKIVHRDLKPQNIFIGKGKVAKIGDFGCSIQMNSQINVMMSGMVGSLAYMDKRVSDGDPYDMSVDIYSFGIIIYCIYKGKGIYDECSSHYNLQRIKSGIYADYDAKMDELIEGFPNIIKRIVKNCLQPDFNRRYSAREIASMISKEVESRKSLMSKIKSTMDQEYIQDESSLFAVGIINYCKNIQKEQRNSATKKKLLQIIHTFKDKFEALKDVQTVKYITLRTKQQFVAFLLFYYTFWLYNLQLLVTNNPTTFSQKYSQIHADSIDESLLARVKEHIRAEKSKYQPCLSRCCRNINSTLRLANQRQYIPQVFKEIIKMVGERSKNIEYEQFQDDQLKQKICSFFQKRLKKQFRQNAQEDSARDRTKLATLQSICQSL